MLKAKKKITKRELKEDKFVLFTIKVKDYIEDNAKLLMQMGIGLLIVIILVSFYVRSKKTANIEANTLLGKAQLANMQGNVNTAETVLKQLVEDFDGVTASGQGCFLLAKIYWEKDDTTNSKVYFKKYFEDYAEDNLLTSAAFAGYADCLLQEGNVKAAAEHYEQASKVDRQLPQTPSYLFSAASAYLEVQDFEKAKKLANDIVENYSTSDYKRKAEILLSVVELKV